jgi:hypothetical protein
MKIMAIDWAIVALYLGVLWSIGLYVAHRHRRHAADFTPVTHGKPQVHNEN